MSPTTLTIEMTHTTMHVTLRWHLEENVDVNWHSLICFEDIMWHFGIEVARQMKCVKHTRCPVAQGDSLVVVLCYVVLWCGSATHLRALVGKSGWTLIWHKWPSLICVLHWGYLCHPGLVLNLDMTTLKILFLNTDNVMFLHSKFLS